MRKAAVLTAPALVAAAIAGGAGQARAFDQVTWTWNADIDADLDQNIWSWGSFVPEGLATIELVQSQIGPTVSRVEIQGDFARDAEPAEGTHEVAVDLGKIRASFDEGDPGEVVGGAHPVGDSPLPYWLPVSNADGDLRHRGSASEDIDLGTILVDVPNEPVRLNAPNELGQVRGAATAVANSSAIKTEVATNVDLDQNAFGGHTFFLSYDTVIADAEAGTPFGQAEAAAQIDTTAIANASSIDLHSQTAPAPLAGGSLLSFSDLTGDHTHNSGDPKVAKSIVSNEILTADIVQTSHNFIRSRGAAYQDLSSFKNLGNYEGLSVGGKIVPGLVANVTSTAIGNLSNVSVTGPTSK